MRSAKAIVSAISTVTMGVFSFVSYIILDLEPEQRIILVLLCATLALSAIIVCFIIVDGKHNKKCESDYKELHKKHSAICGQYDEKSNDLKAYKAAWSFLGNIIVIANEGKPTERLQHLEKAYINYNNTLSKESNNE